MPPTATLDQVTPLPTVDVPDVQLCRTGTWNGHDYTAADLQDAADNWAELRGQFDVPLALGHTDAEHQPAAAMGDGAPAIGWVDNVRFDGEFLLGDYRKVPYRLAQLMQSGGFPKRSCEFYPDVVVGGKTRRLVLWRVALLGANPPAVDGLADVASLYNRRRLLRLAAPSVRLTLAAAQTYKTEGGKQFHKADYAYTPTDTPSDWKLRITATPGAKPDSGIVGAAIAAFGKGFRGQKASIPAADRGAVKSRLRGAWRAANPDKSEDAMPDAIANARLAVSLARLPEPTRAAYDGWRAAHPNQQQLVAGPSLSDIQSAVEDALAKSYPPAEAEGDADGQDGPSQNVLDWYLSGTETSVIVSDQDVDNLWEIPFTYDQSSDTAALGSPIPVKGTYTPNTTGQESGGGGADDQPPAAAAGGDAGPGEAGADGDTDGDAAMQAMSKRAAAVLTLLTLAKGPPVDSDVERLAQKAADDLDSWLSSLNAIAAGKPGVTQLRALLAALKKGLQGLNIANPKTDTPAPQANARQQPNGGAVPSEGESEVKLAELARKLGLPETASEAEVNRALDGAVAAPAVVATLARKVDALLERDAQQEIDTLLGEAVSSGRLKRYNKPGEDGALYTSLRTLARSNLAQAKAIVASLPPFVATGEYGAAGDQGTPQSAIEITPLARAMGASEDGVRRELRKLGRDPDSIDPRPLADRWREQIARRQLARAQKLGIPVRV